MRQYHLQKSTIQSLACSLLLSCNDAFAFFFPSGVPLFFFVLPCDAATTSPRGGSCASSLMGVATAGGGVASERGGDCGGGEGFFCFGDSTGTIGSTGLGGEGGGGDGEGVFSSTISF